MKVLAFVSLGFLLVAGPSLFAFVKIWERIGWLRSRFDEHQERLRGIGTYVVDANERLWGAGMLEASEEELKKRGLDVPKSRGRVEPNFRKWDQ
jgi:hypothetical protein